MNESIKEALKERRKKQLITYAANKWAVDYGSALERYYQMSAEEDQALNAEYEAHLISLAAREDEKIQTEEKQRRICELISFCDSKTPEVFKGARLFEFRHTVFEPYINEALNAKGNWLLFGTVGIGKSRFSWALARAWAERGISSRVTTAFEFVSLVKSCVTHGDNASEVIRQEFGSCGYLILDEVDKISATPAEASYITALINMRYELRKPIFVIGNKGKREPAEILGASNLSRLIGDGSLDPVSLRARDRRLPPKDLFDEV